jgi:hypothetical protein
MTPHDRAVRRAERKEARDPGHSVPRGPSLLSSIEQLLTNHCQWYLEMTDDPGPIRKTYESGVERGVIRGLALAIARIQFPYEDATIHAKRIEREFIAKVVRENES